MLGQVGIVAPDGESLNFAVHFERATDQVGVDGSLVGERQNFAAKVPTMDTIGEKELELYQTKQEGPFYFFMAANLRGGELCRHELQV